MKSTYIPSNAELQFLSLLLQMAPLKIDRLDFSDHHFFNAQVSTVISLPLSQLLAKIFRTNKWRCLLSE
jgi:hypothetical protein